MNASLFVRCRVNNVKLPSTTKLIPRDRWHHLLLGEKVELYQRFIVSNIFSTPRFHWGKLVTVSVRENYPLVKIIVPVYYFMAYDSVNNIKHTDLFK